MLTLDRGVGAHGLLPTGGGDWNDGFDSMGPGAESVWLTWFASTVCHRFSRLLSSLGEPDADRFAQVSRHLGEAADDAWDTDHYLRGYYGDGTPLGARNARAPDDAFFLYGARPFPGPENEEPAITAAGSPCTADSAS